MDASSSQRPACRPRIFPERGGARCRGKEHRTRLIADGYLPPAGAGRLAGHEAICILNTGDQLARVEMDFYFEDREPRLGVYRISRRRLCCGDKFVCDGGGESAWARWMGWWPLSWRLGRR